MSKLPLSFRINMFFKHKARDTDWKTNWDVFQFRIVRVRRKDDNTIVEGYHTYILWNKLLLYDIKLKAYHFVDIYNISEIETIPIFKELMTYHKMKTGKLPKMVV